jgi:uncharacterized protein (TIGR00255 family)
MILSMTGYGQGQCSGGDFVITVSLKSVNHRHFDVSLRLPQELQALENGLKGMLKEKLVRGSVSAFVLLESTAEIPVKVNEPLASAYLRAARELKEKFGLSSELTLDWLLRLPNVVSFGSEEGRGTDRVKEKYGEALEEASQKAVKEIIAMRTQEGKQLEHDLEERTQTIGKWVEVIEEAMRSNAQVVYDKLKEEVMRLSQTASIDPGRLAQEVAYLAEKSDVTEEVTRLKSHVTQFLAMLGESGEIGKKLDFLLQEMHRETNTILSKTSSVCGDARAASDLAIEIKAEIEKLREQVQNVV